MFTLVTIMNITIRNINPSFWRKLKIEAVKEGMTMGQAINLALENCLKRKQMQKKQKSFWELKPYFYQGPDADTLSTKVDEVLYG